MKKNTILLSLFLFSTTLLASNDQKLLTELNPHLGEYRLLENGEGDKKCYFNSSRKDQLFRLHINKADNNTDYNLDHVNIEFQVEYSRDKWFSAFDRAQFSSVNVNRWSRFMPFSMGGTIDPAFVKHRSIFSAKEKTLKHFLKFMSIGSRSGAVQTIKWIDENEFVYTYELVKLNIVGSVKSSEVTSTCRFVRD